MASSIQNTRLKGILIMTFKLALMAGLGYVIIDRVFLSKDTIFTPGWSIGFSSLYSAGFLYFLAAFFLVFVNWGLETIKWQRLTAFHPVTFWKGFESILKGLATGFLTPNRIGDFGGRILEFKREHRWKGVNSRLISSCGQFIVSLGFGSIALGLVGGFYPDLLPVDLPYLPIGILAVLLVITFYIMGKYSGSMRAKGLGVPFMRKHQEKWRPFFECSRRLLSLTLLFSALRYLVFSTQFFLLLMLFGIGSSPTQIYLLIAMVYLFTCIVPGLFLGELGVREGFAVLFFTAAGYSGSAVLSASLLLWLINLALPALIGSLFIAGKKLDHVVP